MANKEEKKDVKVTEDAGAPAAAEGAAAENAEGDAKPKFGLKKIILFVVLPLVVVGGLGAGAFFMGYLDDILHIKPDCAKVKEGEKHYEECQAQKEAEAEGKPGAFLTIPDMIVNLNSSGKQTRFLKISIKLELESPEDQAKIEPLLPRVVDQFQVYLRELRIEDLRGTAGVYRMKLELLSRVRAAAPTVKVRDVLFQEILVQ